jgi:hypothetical protein
MLSMEGSSRILTLLRITFPVKAGNAFVESPGGFAAIKGEGIVPIKVEQKRRRVVEILDMICSRVMMTVDR